ncbi:hypothetical protein [Chitinophaga niabensis]|uniref:DUF3868 domain-containing protein n=1 Tax=Chitinophaga niabensis TaxID=536979 RepID=A0A1N6DEG8_9BACT|nr:hypothetical protein [Chitinophaga niabensis]SIN69156.1 hypothetical protein SAMN04488055_0665 [Chitinophaga niabensis]
MKRSLCLALLLLALRAGAQVSMTPQVPPAGVILKAQLWNIMLVSANDRPLNVRISLRLLDAQTSQPMLTGITRNLIVSKGAKQLQVNDVMPVQYEYLSAVIDRSVNGLLPAGNYLACYTLMVEGDKGNTYREDCIPVTIEPVSPPLLNMPANQSELETKQPQFTWIPPAPAGMFNNLNYEMRVAEIREGQSAAEAVQQNIPVFRVNRQREMYLNYPAGAAKLDTGKNYAWTVIAKNGELFAAQAEVWTFRIKALQHVVSRNNDVYTQLRKSLDGRVVYASGPLQLAYVNETADSTVQYELIALEDQNKVLHNGDLRVKRGNNFLDVPLGKRNKFTEGKSYLFRLRNGRQEYWQLKFIYTRGK